MSDWYNQGPEAGTVKQQEGEWVSPFAKVEKNEPWYNQGPPETPAIEDLSPVLQNYVRNSDDPEGELHKLNSAEHIARYIGKTRGEVFSDYDTYAETFFGTKEPQSNWRTIQNAYKRGGLSLEIGRLGTQLMQAGGEDEIIAKRIEELYQQMPADDQMPRHWLTTTTQTVAESLPLMQFSLQRGALTGTMTMAGGAAMASASGLTYSAGTASLTAAGAGGVAAGFVTIPAVALAALSVGMVAGTVNASREAMGGQQYVDLRKEGIPHEIAYPLAEISGTVQGAVEAVQIATLAGKAPGVNKIVQKASQAMTKKLYMSGALGVIARGLARYGTTAAEEGVEEFAQELTNVATTFLAHELVDKEWEDGTKEQILERFGESFKGGFMASLMLSIPGVGGKIFSDGRTVSKMERDSLAFRSKEDFKGFASKTYDLGETPQETQEIVLDAVYERARRDKNLNAQIAQREQDLDQAFADLDDPTKAEQAMWRIQDINAEINQLKIEQEKKKIEAVTTADGTTPVWAMTKEQARREQASPEQLDKQAAVELDNLAIKIKDRLNVTDEQAAGASLMIDLRANRLGISKQEYLDTRFAPEIFSDIETSRAELAQKGKAAVDFLEDGKAIIHATQNSDFSSWVHELGHVFRRELTEEQNKIVREFTGFEGEWGTEAARAAEEMFAEAHEQYMLNGKAPSKQLEGVFQQFASWMRQVYAFVKNRFGEVSPDIEKVFNDLYAAEPVETRSDISPERGAQTLNQSGLSFEDAVRGSHSGQIDATLTAKRDGQAVGRIDYSEFNGKPHVQMIEVPEAERGSGYGTELVLALQEEYPNTEIDFGMLTDDGKKFYDSLPKRINEQGQVFIERSSDPFSELPPGEASVLYQAKPPYPDNHRKKLEAFIDSMNDEARETYHLLHDVVEIGEGVDKENNPFAKYLQPQQWNDLVKNNPAVAEAARKLYERLPEEVRDNAGLYEDGTVFVSDRESMFKMGRAMIQRVIDALPLEQADPVYVTDGKEVKISDKNAVQVVGGESYRRALVEEFRKLFRDGELKQVKLGSLDRDSWGALGFLATNDKTMASGDFTTYCPQMFFNKGCFYCYRAAALRSGVNNKLTAEKVWYAGEILKIRDEDILELNKRGGLRIQSFGDWMPHFSSMLADVLVDAEMRGLQVKIITKEPSMIETVDALKKQGLGKSLVFNISADYVMEPVGDPNESQEWLESNYDRPHQEKDGKIYWKRALSVEEAKKLRDKHPWVEVRIVANTAEEFLRGLRDPNVDVITGYHGHIREMERIDVETGEIVYDVEPVGDNGMPRFNEDGSIEYKGKLKVHHKLAKMIQEEGLQDVYWKKACCITGKCATCKTLCGVDRFYDKFQIQQEATRDPDTREYFDQFRTPDEASTFYQAMPTTEDTITQDIGSGDTSTLFQTAPPADSPEFKAWFGDSKVVDENGDPLTVYHGTKNQFNAFDTRTAGLQTGTDDAMQGFFFTDSPEVASSYALERMKTPRQAEVKKTKNGLRATWQEYEDSELVEREQFFGAITENGETRYFDTEMYDEGDKDIETMTEAEVRYSIENRVWYGQMETMPGVYGGEVDPSDAQVYPAKLKIENPLVHEVAGPWDPLEYSRVIDKAREAGHDGVVFRGAEEGTQITADTYMVFSPTQVKSVFNKGTFDPENPNILFQSDDPHEAAVRQAVESKLPVPYEVLDEYADRPWAQEEFEARRALTKHAKEIDDLYDFVDFNIELDGDPRHASYYEYLWKQAQISNLDDMYSRAENNQRFVDSLSKEALESYLMEAVTQGNLEGFHEDIINAAEKVRENGELSEYYYKKAMAQIKADTTFYRSQFAAAVEDWETVRDMQEEAVDPIYAKLEKAKKDLAKTQDELDEYVKSARAEAKKQTSVAKKDTAKKERARAQEIRKRERLRRKEREWRDLLVRAILKPVPKNVAWAYKVDIEEIQSGFTLLGTQSKEYQARKRIAEMLAENPNMPLSRETIQELQRKPIKELTNQELEEVLETIKHLLELGRSYYYMEQNKEWFQVNQLREEAIRTLTGQDHPDNLRVVGSKEWKEEIKTSRIRKVQANTLRPSRLFDMMDGGKEGIFTRWLWAKVNEAEDATLRAIDERIEKGEKVMQELKITPSQLGRQITVEGHTLTADEVIHLHIAALNEDSRDAILYGNNFGTMALVHKFILQLTHEERRWGDFLMSDFSDENFKRLNQVLLKLENRSMTQVVNYFPIRRQDGSYDTLDAEIKDELLGRSGAARAYVGKGFTKERTMKGRSHQTPMKLGATAVWMDQVAKQEKYIHQAELNRRLHRVFGNEEVQEAVRQTYGEDFNKMIRKYINDIADPNIYKTMDGTTQISRMLRQHAALSYLAFNAVTVLKQLPSVAYYLGHAGPHELLASAGQLVTNPRKIINMVNEKDPQMKHRSLERVMEEIKHADRTVYQKIIQKIGKTGMFPIKVMDKFATLIGWHAVYSRAIRQGLSEEEAIRKAQNATLTTQPAARAKDIAQIYRSNEGFNWFLMFSNQLNQIFNITTYDIPRNIRAKKAGVALGQMTGVIIGALAMGMIVRKRPPEDEKEVGIDLLNQVLSAIPVVGGSIKSGVEGWFGTGVDPFPLAHQAGSLARKVATGTAELDDLVRTIMEALVVSGLPSVAPRRLLDTIESGDLWDLIGGGPEE